MYSNTRSRRVGFLGCLLTVVIAAPTSASNIGWLTFHTADNAPATDAAAAGFTDAPDKGYTDLLTTAGHTVTRVLTKNAPDATDLAALNNFDLVIVGRSIDSANYGSGGSGEDAAERQFWNSDITKPVILMSGYVMRNSRLGFTTGTTIPDISGPVKLAVTDPAHPIFSGISLDASNVMVNDYADLAMAPFAPNAVQRGISVNTNPLAGGGKLLASIDTAADPAVGGTIIAKWSPGDVTSVGNALGGHRLVFLSGSREASGVSSQTAGIFDLSQDGQKMFLNSVDFMLTIPEPSTISMLLLVIVGLGLRRRH
jgi:PEP-CTERM motif